jgi:hypothetical protein
MKKTILFILVLLSQYLSTAQIEAVEKGYLVSKMTEDAVHEMNEALEIHPSASFNKNLIAWKMSDMIFQRLSFNYQHVFGEDGKIAVYLPVSVFFW